MLLLFATLILFSLYPLIDSEWISHSDNTLPRDDTMCAIGNYNNTIFLLGGFNKMRQITNYDIQSDTFVLYKSSFVPITNKVFGEAQYYTQLSHNLYFLDDLESQNIKLMVYNMANNSFISDFYFIPVSMSDGMGRSCIASSSVNNTIYINGGISDSNIPMNETYVLHIETMQWNLTSPMQTPRRSHSCMCDNNYLYSIGGSSTNSLTATIEKISIDNMKENQWIYLNGSLSRPLKGLRSFIYETNIIVIGGMDDRIFYDTVHIINTITDSVTVSDMKSAFSTAYTAAIMVGNVMYAFAGGAGVNEWQSQTIFEPAGNLSTTSFDAIIPNTTLSDSVTDRPTSIPTQEREKSEESASTGNKVGIGLGIGLFLCLAVVLVFFFFQDKTKKGEDFSQIDGESGNSGNDYDENGQLTDHDHDEQLHAELFEKKIPTKNSKQYV